MRFRFPECGVRKRPSFFVVAAHRHQVQGSKVAGCLLSSEKVFVIILTGFKV